jgi:hypothetical protein
VSVSFSSRRGLWALAAAAAVTSLAAAAAAAPSFAELQAREAFAAGRYGDALGMFAKLYLPAQHRPLLPEPRRARQGHRQLPGLPPQGHGPRAGRARGDPGLHPGDEAAEAGAAAGRREWPPATRAPGAQGPGGRRAAAATAGPGGDGASSSGPPADAGLPALVVLDRRRRSRGGGGHDRLPAHPFAPRSPLHVAERLYVTPSMPTR